MARRIFGKGVHLESWKILVSVKENMTFAEKDLAGLLQVLQTQLSPLKVDSSQTHDLLIIVTSKSLGHGNEELGKILMKFFLKSLSASAIKPKGLALLSDAVHLACEHSPVLNSLSLFVEQGIKVFVDGTSVDYYQIEGKIKVGQVVSMLAICTEILNAGRIISL